MADKFTPKFELTPKVTVADASEIDIEDILSIQSQRIIIPEADVKKQNLEKTGFLIYPTSADDLKRMLEDDRNHLIKVAKEKNKTVGYLISYDMKQWELLHPDWFSRLCASEDDKKLIKDEKGLYGRHVAVDEHVNISDVGKELLDSTLQEAINRGYRYFIVEILEKPIKNKRSMRFVQKAGFRLIGQMEDQNNRIWSVFLKDLAK